MTLRLVHRNLLRLPERLRAFLSCIVILALVVMGGCEKKFDAERTCVRNLEAIVGLYRQRVATGRTTAEGPAEKRLLVWLHDWAKEEKDVSGRRPPICCPADVRCDDFWTEPEWRRLVNGEISDDDVACRYLSYRLRDFGRFPLVEGKEPERPEPIVVCIAGIQGDTSGPDSAVHLLVGCASGDVISLTKPPSQWTDVERDLRARIDSIFGL